MDDALRQKLQTLISSHPVVLFMKGNRQFPQCGFSAKVVELLKRNGADFQTVNVLTEQDVRQGLKEFSSWPTFPQLYVKGEFIGGCDIVTELDERGELGPLLSSAKPAN
ncbi:MAG: Grx4 family monothiol glutaredoxin [Polyangiaceae bacterium]|nr:Grx4 family monothiol glutaredoxin [Polyangiaceae bacterium]